MRNKELFERKFEQMESILTRLSFSISRNEQRQGLEDIAAARNLLSDLSTLLDNEYQDPRY